MKDTISEDSKKEILELDPKATFDDETGKIYTCLDWGTIQNIISYYG
jgi:hypothetical protein